MTRKEALEKAWTLYYRYPGDSTAILTKLEDYGISVEQFNKYDNEMATASSKALLDRRAEALSYIEGHSQNPDISDIEVLSIFNSRDELQAKKEAIDKPPTDAEWYLSGLLAEQEIDRLRPLYERQKAEEWEQLESPGIYSGITGPVQFLTEAVAGGMDFRHDFKEDLHERGFLSSPNPLTGFGAWDIAEFQKNVKTGETGFSEELLGMEDRLEDLYGQKREYNEQMTAGGYREAFSVDEEIASLNKIIMDNRLLDPRLTGEIQ